MSLRLVPENDFHSKVDSVKFGEAAPSAPALQDILRAKQGPLSIASQVNGRHPLESRIKNWEETEQNMKMEQYRRIFGAGEPIKRKMDLSIVESTDFKPSVLGGSSNIHKNILLNKDSTIDWEDIYDGFETKNHMDYHSELEKKMGI
ncbi:hypothetical protein PACTADRAFT_47487 [Pachysolen tannophilus NRRL Y-2460]|uniref:Proteasome maturation factor UMP1 n=1 Tax=Pachysolen tannophilus NRRL Y-2460 TaxID=669874 RepID=A0A1E4U0Z3_PACTA|nr:hypothetical protein PACTADRAFT_47487 [Pachysolen tannophilus NRRL Y-2460]